MTERLKFSSILIGNITLASDRRRNQQRKYGARFSSLMRKVCFNQSPQAAHHHLVAGAEHDCCIVSMSFNKSSQTCGKDIPGQKSVVHSVRAIRKFLARRRVRDFEWNRAVCPELADHSPNGFLG